MPADEPLSETSAHHEAGHAVVAVHVGARVESVTIDPDWDDGPARYADAQIEWPVDDFTPREYREKQILVALAGPVAEMIHTGDPYHPSLVAEWSGDWRLAWESAEPLIPDERKRLNHLERTAIDLYRFLGRDDVWAAVAALADELLAHETLEGEQVEDVVRQWLG